MEKFKKLLYPLRWTAVFFYFAFAVWCFGAAWYSNLPGAWLRVATAVLFALTVLICFFIPRRKLYPRIFAVLLMLGVLCWWLCIPASNDRDWQIWYSRMPYAEISGNRMTIHNIRDFKYRSATDFDPCYITADYDLRCLRDVRFAVSYWDGNKAVAHTMLEFEFSKGRNLVFSIETRLEKGEKQSAIPGLFKQYENLYIIGTVDDLFGLRVNYRQEDLYVYPTVTTPAQAGILFTDLIRRCNRLRERPEFYNTLLHNCTTSLASSIFLIRPGAERGFDIRLLLNGYSDEMAFEGGWLRRDGDKDESFDAYKKRHRLEKSGKQL